MTERKQVDREGAGVAETSHIAADPAPARRRSPTTQPDDAARRRSPTTQPDDADSRRRASKRPQPDDADSRRRASKRPFCGCCGAEDIFVGGSQYRRAGGRCQRLAGGVLGRRAHLDRSSALASRRPARSDMASICRGSAPCQALLPRAPVRPPICLHGQQRLPACNPAASRLQGRCRLPDEGCETVGFSRPFAPLECRPRNRFSRRFRPLNRLDFKRPWRTASVVPNPAFHLTSRSDALRAGQVHFKRPWHCTCRGRSWLGQAALASMPPRGARAARRFSRSARACGKASGLSARTWPQGRSSAMTRARNTSATTSGTEALGWARQPRHPSFAPPQARAALSAASEHRRKPCSGSGAATQASSSRTTTRSPGRSSARGRDRRTASDAPPWTKSLTPRRLRKGLDNPRALEMSGFRVMSFPPFRLRPLGCAPARDAKQRGRGHARPDLRTGSSRARSTEVGWHSGGWARNLKPNGDRCRRSTGLRRPGPTIAMAFQAAKP